jgi:ribonuclease D
MSAGGIEMRALDGMSVRYIASAAELESAASRWLEQPLVALDSEFMRVRTYYAQPALFQVCDAEQCYLIDPLAIDDLEPLARVLRAPAVTKIMHSCSEDLEVCPP